MNRYKLVKAGVDYNKGLNRFNGNKELYDTLLSKFKEDVNLEGLQRALSVSDAESAFKFAHSLKGIAANLSLVQLYDDIFPLVERLRDGNLDNAKELIDKVKSSYNTVIEAVE